MSTRHYVTLQRFPISPVIDRFVVSDRAGVVLGKEIRRAVIALDPELNPVENSVPANFQGYAIVSEGEIEFRLLQRDTEASLSEAPFNGSYKIRP